MADVNAEVLLEARRLGALFNERLAEKGWPHVPTLHQSDPPEHTRYRRLLNKVFSPGRVRQMIPDVERICDQLIGSFAGLLFYSFKALPIRFAGAGTTDRSAGK